MINGVSKKEGRPGATPKQAVAQKYLAAPFFHLPAPVIIRQVSITNR